MKGRTPERWNPRLWIFLTCLLLLSAPPAPLLGAQVRKPAPAGGEARAPEVLEAMDGYVGHWRSDEKTGPEGGTFHFEYELSWLDSGRTIARMVITRVGPEGVGTVFEGYKGREPTGDGVYYWAVSPSGRASQGKVSLEGENLVTLYRGWTAEGDVVRIRDVFTPVRDGTFTSRTFLRSSPGGEWRQIGQDRWTRTAPPRRPDPSTRSGPPGASSS